MFEFGLIEKGGIIMLVLMALSVYALGVIFFKIHQFYTAGIWNNKFIDYTMQPIRRGELSVAMRMLAPIRNPVARVMRVSIECMRSKTMSAKHREAEISRIGSQELRYMESHLRGLELAAACGPLLGLLGTVTGMVASFSSLSQAGARVDPSMLAAGIWEALLTTAAGLIVAIPALAAYYIFDTMIERVRAQMKDVTVQILSLEDRVGLHEEESLRLEAERLEQERELEAERHWQAEQERANLAEQERVVRMDVTSREEYWRRMAEEQEKTIEALRTGTKATNTLRLLNPTYRY